jgi:hypothetical protein
LCIVIVAGRHGKCANVFTVNVAENFPFPLFSFSFLFNYL